jgi:CheY-like chemotaxis protein
VKTILVADTNVAIVTACAQALKRAGYLVITASDRQATLKTLSLVAVDLVLCDASMTGDDGSHTIHAVRQRIPNTPIIALCSAGPRSSPDSAIAQAKRAGVEVALTKPVSDSELTKAVTDLFPAPAALRIV